MTHVAAFGRFWWDFIVGDDWLAAAGVAVALGVTAIVVAPIIGWQIDAWLSTTPIFFIIFLILGMVAGLVNVYRVAVRPTGPKRGTE